MIEQDELKVRQLSVGLIDPPTGLFIREDRCQAPIPQIGVAVLRPPIELAHMAGVFLQQGCSCYMRDYPGEMKGWEDLRQDLLAEQPDILVINTTVYTIHQDLHVCEIAKELLPHVLTVARGLYGMVWPEDLLRSHDKLDVVVVGESEPVAEQLAKRKRLEEVPGIVFRQGKEIRRSEKECLRADLDLWPFPARQCMNLDLYRNATTGERETTIQVSRGCAGGCSFCVAATIAGKIPRLRSYENILKEVRECIERYKIRSFFFRADTFTYDKTWVLGLCEEIIRQKIDIQWVCNTRVDTIDEPLVIAMRRAGCYAVTMGIESGNQETLDRIRKGISIKETVAAVRMLKAHGLITIGYFMIGFPDDTVDTINETMRFSVALDLDAANFYIAYPFPGTAFHTICQERGLLEREPFSRLPYVEAAVHTRFLTAEDLVVWRKRMIRNFYLRPEYIIRQLRTRMIRKQWRSMFAMGLRMLFQGM